MGVRALSSYLNHPFLFGIFHEINHPAIKVPSFYGNLNPACKPRSKYLPLINHLYTTSIPLIFPTHMGVSINYHKLGYPNTWMLYFMEKPTKMDENWGYP